MVKFESTIYMGFSTEKDIKYLDKLVNLPSQIYDKFSIRIPILRNAI